MVIVGVVFWEFVTPDIFLYSLLHDLLSYYILGYL